MSNRTEHNKLVRDKIPNIIRTSGSQCETTILSNLDYIEALKQKLVEEAQEVATAKPEELAQELADIIEVMDAPMAAAEIEPETVKEIQKEKRCQRTTLRNRNVEGLIIELNYYGLLFTKKININKSHVSTSASS